MFPQHWAHEFAAFWKTDRNYEMLTDSQPPSDGGWETLITDRECRLLTLLVSLSHFNLEMHWALFSLITARWFTSDSLYKAIAGSQKYLETLLYTLTYFKQQNGIIIQVHVSDQRLLLNLTIFNILYFFFCNLLFQNCLYLKIEKPN